MVGRWTIPTSGLHTPSKPSIAGMGTRAEETERSRQMKGAQTRLQHRAQLLARQNLPCKGSAKAEHPHVLRCTLTWHNTPQHILTWLLPAPTCSKPLTQIHKMSLLGPRTPHLSQNP